MKIYRLILVTGFIILFLSSCLKDESFKLPYSGYVPLHLDDGWEISTPEGEDVDSELLDSAYRIIYNEDRYKLVKSLLVIRNGNIIAEAYPNDLNDLYQIQNIQSATKAITSLLTGIAFEKGLLDSLNQTLSSIYPNKFIKHQDKSHITLHHVLTMTTGIGFNNSDHTGAMYLSSNSVDYVLSLPMTNPPGYLFSYNDGNPQLISYAIQSRFGKPLSDFAEEYLFEPLGITDWIWESANEGTTFGAFSLFLKPRDMAKIGQLLLQSGNWEGRQLIDSTWISLATTEYYSYRPYWVYGYYFWLSPFENIFFYC